MEGFAGDVQVRLPWKYPRIDLGRPQIRIPCQIHPTDTADEQWRPVPGWERFYRVSTLGRVWSLHQYGRIIVGMTTRDGYHVIKLRENRRYAYKGVHVLVLMAFIGPRPSDAHEGCHNDGNPGNDRLDNLRWDTASGNQLDRRKHGTAKYAAPKLTEEHVSMIRTSPEIPDLEWARLLNVSRSAVATARLKKTFKDVPEAPFVRPGGRYKGGTK
jgi:hypothetical protein